MNNPLNGIFTEGLFQASKAPNRDWEKIADRAGNELYEEIGSMFQHPEVALCACVRVVAELCMIQPDKYKRQRLLEKVKEAIKELTDRFDKEAPEDRDAYEYESEEEPEDVEPEDEPEEEPLPPAKHPQPAGNAGKNQPDLPGPEPEEEEEPEEPDPDQSEFRRPVRNSGWKPKRRSS